MMTTARAIAIGATLVLAFPALGAGQQRETAAGEGVRTFVQEQTYPVAGSTFLEAYQEIEALGPEDSGGQRRHGLTAYELEPSWQFVESRGSCRMGSASVVARVSVTLPDWEGAGAADEASRVAWDRYILELRAHEYQHRDYVIEAAEGLQQQLEELRSGRCDALRSQANQRTTRAYRKLQERQAALDREAGSS